jgi:hypothetical protein
MVGSLAAFSQPTEEELHQLQSEYPFTSVARADPSALAQQLRMDLVAATYSLHSGVLG